MTNTGPTLCIQPHITLTIHAVIHTVRPWVTPFIIVKVSLDYWKGVPQFLDWNALSELYRIKVACAVDSYFNEKLVAPTCFPRAGHIFWTILILKEKSYKWHFFAKINHWNSRGYGCNSVMLPATDPDQTKPYYSGPLFNHLPLLTFATCISYDRLNLTVRV